MYVGKSACAVILGLAAWAPGLAALQTPPDSAAAMVPSPAAEAPSAARIWQVDQDASVFAVVTQKGGFAARLAHNHLIVARGYDVAFEFDPENLPATTFQFETPSAQLVVDDPVTRERWQGRIVELGLVDDLGEPGEDDREEIRQTMLSDDQLDAEEYPTISVQVQNVVEGESPVGPEVFAHLAEVAISVHGQTILRDVPARFRIDGDRIFVEAVGHFTFEEFGIEPYSAFMGSVKNKNEFVFYLNLEASR